MCCERGATFGKFSSVQIELFLFQRLLNSNLDKRQKESNYIGVRIYFLNTKLIKTFGLLS